MRAYTLITAALLPLTAFTTQIPIVEKVEKDKLSKVISDSPLLSLHRSLCQIPSVSNNEHDVGRWLQKFLEAHHFKVITQLVPFDKGKPSDKKSRLNIYTYPDPKHYGTKGSGKHHGKHSTAPKAKVLLTSHIDTVPPHIPYSLHYNSTKSPFDRSNILIHGRGTVDDKACVATQITAALSLLLHPPSNLTFHPTDLALLFVVDEEVGGAGMRHFSSSQLYNSTSSTHKAILFGEPTERKLVSAHKGIMMLSIEAHGKAAHSGYPWLGRSANSLILPTLTMLDQLESIPEDQGGLPGSAVLGNTTINVGFIQGGVAANVVPEHASASIAFRLAAGSYNTNKALIQAAIARTDPKAELDVKFGVGYGPIHLDADVEGFDTIAVNYGTDVPWLEVPAGVKRYLYGPGSIFVAHGADEGLTVGELEAGLEGYKKLLEHALAL